jgi:PhnB protein
MRLEMPGGEIAHAEIRIGNSHVMLADEFPEMGAVGPQTLNGTSVSLMVYVDDCDSQFEKAIASGGKPIRPMADQFYGDRSGTFVDPFGHTWTVGTHKVDMTPAELQAAMQREMAG